MSRFTHRYPGVRPFEASEKHLFFGRNRDIEDLYDLILLERLSVLFGKSGYGKSSLLNAGVLPRFTHPDAPESRRYRPVQVRFGAYQPGKSIPPLDAVVNALDAFTLSEPYRFLATLIPAPRLWSQFKMRQSVGDTSRFLLVFDQFEEFFTYPEAEQAAFRAELAELLYEEVPQDVRLAARACTREQRAFLSEAFDAKALFVIRSDRLSLLDGMKDKLPGILHKRYELQALDAGQAREAIVMPALLPATAPGQSPPFHYSEDAIDKMLSELSGKDSARKGAIEPFQLQIVCASIEKRVTEQGIDTVTAAELPDFSTVYEDYYKGRIGELPEAEQEQARRVVEDGLLLVDEQTGEARRLSRDSAELAQSLRVSPDLLKNLERTYLLRREANSLGGFNYEISHDTLIAPVLKARREREAAIEQQRLLQEQAEAERRALEAEKKAQEETARRAEAERLQRAAEKAKRRATVFALGAAALAVVAGIAFFYAKTQNAKAKADQERAEKAEIKAIAKAEEASQQKDLANARADSVKIQKTVADSLKGVAETEASRAKRALESVVRANAKVVDGLLTDARKDVLALQYDAALVKLRNAAGFLQKKTDVANALLEIVWVYDITGRRADAAKELFLAANLLSKNISLPSSADQAAIRNTMKRIAPKRLTEIEARYYPKMVLIKKSEGMPAFLMAETETTVWQYAVFLGARGESIHDDKVIPRPGWGWQGDNPAVFVSWYDAIEYANWLSRQFGRQAAYAIDKTQQDPDNISEMDQLKWAVSDVPGSKGYRLPSGAEWDYAARGGPLQAAFEYAGNDLPDIVAWHAGKSRNRTQPVRKLRPNNSGLYDLSGNAWEWCFDWDEISYGRERVRRGGSWANLAETCRISTIGKGDPVERTNQTGFRVAAGL